MATKAAAKKGAPVRGKRRERKNIERGCAHIQSTFNNTIVTITDVQGNAVSSSNLLLICVYSNDGNMQQPSEAGSFPVRFCKASIKRDDAWAGGSRYAEWG